MTGVVALAAALASGETKALTQTRAMLERIAARDGRLRADGRRVSARSSRGRGGVEEGAAF